jgi:hypothetical protein
MYFITPNYSVAINPKVGSSSLALGIIRKFYPEINERIQTADYPSHISPETMLWHRLLPKEIEPTKQVVLIIREPIERFISACSFMKLNNAELAIDSLISGTSIFNTNNKKIIVSENVHFKKQKRLFRENAILFSIENIDEAAQLIGLDLPLFRVNKSDTEKLTLTSEQKNILINFYQEDLELYDSL